MPSPIAIESSISAHPSHGIHILPLWARKQARRQASRQAGRQAGRQGDVYLAMGGYPVLRFRSLSSVLAQTINSYSRYQSIYPDIILHTLVHVRAVRDVASVLITSAVTIHLTLVGNASLRRSITLLQNPRLTHSSHHHHYHVPSLLS